MDFTAIIVLVVGLLAGFAIGSLRGRQSLASAVARPAFDSLMQEKTTLETRLSSALELKQELETKMEKARQELMENRERAIIAESNSQALATRLKEQAQELEKMQAQLKLEFKNTATGLLEEIGQKFNTQSEKQIGELLTPLRERMGEFQKKVDESFKVQGQEQHTLKAEIEKIVLQTDTLAKALRGDVKAQGNWGEVMLERILEESGLRKGSDYVLQGVDMSLVASDGSRQMPDVIVNLPDNKHVIIDAKVSLTAYDRYSSENDATAKEVYLRDFLKSVKAHVNGLEQRRYQDNPKISTPDFVLMFMPIEGAYSLAVQQDRELHSYAWGKRIVIVCPTTLMATLKTINSLWKIERQNANAQEIAAAAGALYDKFVGFMENMDTIGDRLTKLQDSYDEAFKKLSKGKGNLVGRAEKLKELGIPTSKSLLKIVKNDEETEEEVPQALSDA